MNTLVLKSASILPGECFTLPRGARVVTVTGDLTNSCGIDLPDAEPLVLYEYGFAINNDNNDDHPVGGNVNIDSFFIEGLIVPLGFREFNTDNTAVNISGINTWSLQIPNINSSYMQNVPIKFQTITTYRNDKSDIVAVRVKMPVSFASKAFLKITNDKFLTGIYLKPKLA